ncbi:hypothetical protein IQ257_20620 [Coleofasciculus sp. LEGE 07092]|nr:hypothetical protein [Coleofasciculus sp. LEGE 07081]MBE9150849.1 hypothetical protein [Coleofasciculus sp. LEGE 07092]
MSNFIPVAPQEIKVVVRFSQHNQAQAIDDPIVTDTGVFSPLKIHW